MGMEYDFIINPKARSGLGELVWNRLTPELKKRGVSYQAHMTEGPKHAQRIAARITSDGRGHTVVVLGGDGTVNEVINGLCDLEKVTLGYIPVGSGNDFARGMGLPGTPEEALRVVLSPDRTVPMDIGWLAWEKKPERARRFVVSAGIGFDAAVCHEVCVSRWKKILNKIGLGKLSYAVVALDRLMKDHPVRLTVTLPDGNREIFEKTYFAAFMNLDYEGGGFRFCPEASPEDGTLDVLVAHGLSRLKILFLLPTAFWGKHVGFRGVTILKCRGLSAETDRPLALHTDGEPAFPRKKIRVGILDKKLRVLTGPAVTEQGKEGQKQKNS